MPFERGPSPEQMGLKPQDTRIEGQEKQTECFDKSRVQFLDFSGDAYYRQKFERVLNGLDTSVDHSLLNKTNIEFITIEPKTHERPDGTIVFNIRRDSPEDIVRSIADILSRRKQSGVTEIQTESSETKPASPEAPAEVRKEVSSPPLQPESEQKTELSLKDKVEEWRNLYGIRLGYMGSKISPESFAANAEKLSQVFQRVISERELGRLNRAYFNLVDSGGSGRKQGELYLDISEDSEKLFQTLIRNTGRGN